MTNPNQVHLVVQSLSGSYEGTFNVHQKIQHVIDKAFEEIGIVPAPADVWELRYDEALLNPESSIEDAGIPDGATLLLSVVEGGGGH